jgi:multiple sugar transport system ATP-binding protein
VGEPNDIFNAPENRFIATFIGQPSMNILDANVSEAGEVTVPGNNDVRLHIDPSAIYAVSAGERETQLGFRPQHASFVDDAGEALLSATLNVWEPIGTGYICHLMFNEKTEVKLVAEDVPVEEPGETVYIGNVDRWYLFDIETGDSIYQSGEKVATAGVS